MKLYHGWLSSASRRVRLCLAEKGIDFESVIVDLRKLEQHSPEYLKINPNGVIPTLVLDDGRALHESSTICEYLDDLVPDPPLRPRDAYDLATMRNHVRFLDERMIPNLLVLNWSASLQPGASQWTDDELRERIARIPTPERRHAWSRIARNPFSDEEKQTAARNLIALLPKLEQMLGRGRWLIGDTYSLADIATTSFVARVNDLSPEAFAQAPRVAAWWQAMQQRPAFTVARYDNFNAALAQRAP